MQLPKGRFPYIFGSLFAIVMLCLLFVLPETIANKKSERFAADFAAPLFEHEMPKGARFISSSASEDQAAGSTSATIILQSEWTKEQIEQLYQDRTYPPARENDEVTLSIIPLDDSSLNSLKQAGLYQESGGSYWFIYLYSAPSA